MKARNRYDAGIPMLNLVNKSISQVLFVIGYMRDSAIRTKQFDIEKALTPLIVGSSVNTNLPDDFNPQAPRVTLRQGRLSVHFSQLTAQLTIDIDNTNGKSLDVIRDSIAKKINLFQDCVDKIIPHEQQRERGLVLTMLYPIDSTQFSDEDVFNHIQSNFFKISPLGEPASAQLNVGYKTDDNFFITLSVAQYKMAAGEVPTMSVAEWFDITKLPVIESGIELKIDVNSRPLVDIADQPADVTSVILKKTFDFVMDEADKFMGKQK
ncbi:hypothetical protein CRENPOLYSF2_2080003 [Crenothrix polyspora]|uniref:TIGR04255 family protein n=1 Tax=Crenothrix polyspora TaxID=360316 RepID=A0A1R4H4H9_9GAMM|nr:hypothetical protein [Crenothrix polyspora]SJM91152.1 hypothetical protein CRENPOLYSF2_2080003 [Crenothrix polyspora]